MAVGFCSVLSAFLLAVTVTRVSEPAMKSIGYTDGSLHVDTNTPVPEIREGDVLIKVEAAGVNRLDLSQAKGAYPPPPGESGILGVEVSGTVAELSPLAGSQSGLKKGDRVMALVGGGGYAEFCRAPYQVVMRVPEGITLTHASGIPEVFLTAYQALVWNGHLKDRETILIHAGASGVGLAAIQLCKVLFKDVRVIATASSEEKLAVCSRYGADVVVNYKTQDFAVAVLSVTGDKGADVILDFVGASYWEKHLKCVAVDGRIVNMGFLGGAVTEGPFNMGILLRKRVTLVYSTLRTRPLEYRERLVKELCERALPHFTTGALKVPVDSTFPLEQANSAHKRMRENKNIGKLILTLI